MYSGVTQGLFKIIDLKLSDGYITYGVKLNELLVHGLKVGASVSIDGVCQTVVRIDCYNVYFNASPKTLKLTTLDSLKCGQHVSIERSIIMGDEVGGHCMAGHIYETARIAESHKKGVNLQLVIQLSPRAIKYVFDKGFIGVNGSSLTVHDVNLSKRTFAVSLIPHTLAITNFKNKDVGSKVNIELDANTVTIVETIRRLGIRHLTQENI